jgi:histidinol-phosphate aminotransferase
MAPPDPRPELRGLSPAHHGSRVPRELEAAGHNPADVLDFSSNINPFGPSPAVARALAELDPAPYPDRHSDTLSRAIAGRDGVPREWTLLGNGASELIWLIALAYADRGRRVAVFSPTFSEYAHACRAMGAEVVEVWADEADGYAFHPEMVNALEEAQPDIVFLCNPNNPTGRLLSAHNLRLLRAAVPDALWVIDEAYHAFVERPPKLEGWLREGAGTHLLLLRSLTKDNALAGLRLGYLLGRAETLAPLRAVQPPWSVNAAAQVAGLAAMEDGAHLTRTLADTRYVGEKLQSDLRALGLAVLPSDTHYALVNVGDGAAFRAALLAHGIQVRDCASLGLPSYVRIAPRQPADNARLLEAVASVLGDYQR